MAKNGILKNLKKKKAEELGKKSKGKECQKPSMSLESNVGMVKGNKKSSSLRRTFEIYYRD